MKLHRKIAREIRRRGVFAAARAFENSLVRIIADKRTSDGERGDAVTMLAYIRRALQA